MNRLESLTSYWHFVTAALTKHHLTGAVIPSQRFLIDKMINPVPPDFEGMVLELGAGTGALTVRLATRCPRSRILACEINPVLADDLKQRLSRAEIKSEVRIVTGNAEALLSRFRGAENERPDFIISGIPLGNLDPQETFNLIDSIAEALPDGGTYIQFQHSLMDRSKIRARLQVVQTVPVWLNFPPAFIYYARKPNGGRPKESNR